MKILFLTQVLPYPPDAGPKFKTWQVLQHLMAQGHEVTLVSMIRSEEMAHCATVQRQVTAFHPVPIRRSRIKDGVYLLRSVLTGRSFLIERDDRRTIRKLVNRLVSENGYDAIHADQITMTQFALPYVSSNGVGNAGEVKRSPQLLFDAHNATWKILERFASEYKGIKRLFFQIEARRMRRYESEIVSRFDRVLAVSKIDQLALLDAVVQSGQPLNGVGEKFSVIPITVDTQEILPVNGNRNPLNLFTMGTLHYPPNADGIRWFVNEVFPLIQKAAPKVTLTIVGKHPPADFINLQYVFPEVYQVPGYVPSLTPWFEQATIMIVPVRVGGGMRVRILEAFARAMPVVTTTIGLEGIDAVSGEDVMVADEPNAFAGAVIRLLEDEELRKKLAANGRKLVEQKYDKQVVLQQLEEIYPLSKDD